MRVFQISSLMMIFSVVSILFVAGCDNNDEQAQSNGSAGGGNQVLPVTAEGAAKLQSNLENSYYVDSVRDVFEEGIEKGQKLIKNAQKRSGKPVEDVSFDEYMTFDGEYAVIPNGDHYQITFPNRTTIMPPEEKGGALEKIEIFHNLGLKAWPTANPATYRMEFVADEKPLYVMAYKEGQAYEVASLTFKSEQKFNALWHNDFESFMQMTGAMQDVTFNVDVPEELRTNRNDIESFSILISNIVSNAKMQPDENNLWSGPFDISFEGIKIEFAEGEGQGEIAHISVKDDNAKKFNPAIYSQFLAVEDKHREILYADEINSTNINAEVVAFREIFEALMMLMTDGLESSDLKLIVEGMKFSFDVVNETTGEAQDFSLDMLELSLPISNDGQGHTNIGFGYKLQGMNMGLATIPGGEVPAEILPKNINFDVVFENLPLKGIGNKIMAAAEETGDDHDAFMGRMMQAQPELMNMLVEADTKVKVNDTYVGNDIWLLLVNSDTQMNPQSPMMVQGDSKIRFYGMDYLMKILDQRMKSPDTAPAVSMMIQQYAQGLAMMQMFGQQSKDDNGRDYRGYNIVIAPDGSVTMNGTDMTQMMGMMQ